MRHAVFACAVLVLLFGGCRFKPTIDGHVINDCTTDADCPTCGRCVAGLCNPSEPILAELTLEAVTPRVEAGDSCELRVVGSNCAAEYVWRQVVGPRVVTDNTEPTRLTLTTRVGHVGNYTFEVRAYTGGGQEQTARIGCTAIVDSEAKYIVPGQTGSSCTLLEPCGTIDDAKDSSDVLPRRIYLGVDAAKADGTPTVFHPAIPDSLGVVVVTADFDFHEVHGGFLFPDWIRDVDRAATTLTDGGMLSIQCADCQFSGLLQELEVDDTDTWYPDAVEIWGRNVTFREARIVMRGVVDGDVGMIYAAEQGLVLESIVGRATGGLSVRDAIGITISGGVGGRVSDIDIDMTEATAERKRGLVISGGSPHLERVRVITGGASDEVVGVRVSCATPTIWNSVFDARGGTPVWSDGMQVMEDMFSGCTADIVTHSSLYIGGSGEVSAAIRFLGENLNGAEITNCILDAGDGIRRFGVFMWDSVLSVPTVKSSVLVLPPAGAVVVAPGGVQGSAGIQLITTAESLEQVFQCTDCFDAVENAHQVSRDGLDFHLTEESTCCIGSGAFLDSNSPSEDFDTVTRPQSPLWPSVGPYELVE